MAQSLPLYHVSFLWSPAIFPLHFLSAHFLTICNPFLSILHPPSPPSAGFLFSLRSLPFFFSSPHKPRMSFPVKANGAQQEQMQCFPTCAILYDG
ncbi:hypothetical protein FKM82_007792 [Ascaphus truei]